MEARLGAFAVAVAAAVGAPQVLTLEEALRLARARQPQLAVARAAAEAGRARSDEARAGLLPQVSINAQYERTTANFVARPSVVPLSTSTLAKSPTWQTFDFFNGTLQVSQLVWDFGQTSQRWRAAQANADALGQNERTTAQSVSLNVRTAFFNAFGGKALVQVARETAANLERHLLQTQAFVQQGTRAPIDLATALTNLANAKAQLVTAEGNYRAARAQLNQAIGLPSTPQYELADPGLAPVEGEGDPLETLVAEAEQVRPELASLEYQIEAQRRTARALRGAYGPALSAGANGTEAGTQLSGLSWNVAATVTLSWSPYQGGLTSAQVHEAEATLRQLEAQLEQERLQVRFEVEQAQVGVQTAAATLASQREAVINAREQLRLAEGRFATGVGNSVELNDAQVALTNAESQEVAAAARLSTARAQLAQALGRP
jgi:outer membrane protein